MAASRGGGWFRNLLNKAKLGYKRARDPDNFLLKEGLREAGQDLDGRRYYELPKPDGRIGRFVHGENHVDPFMFADRHIPTEWQSWLRRRRKDPPTIEELLRNEHKKTILAGRVKELAAKEKELRLEAVAAGIVSPDTPDKLTHASLPNYWKGRAPLTQADFENPFSRDSAYSRISREARERLSSAGNGEEKVPDRKEARPFEQDRLGNKNSDKQATHGSGGEAADNQPESAIHGKPQQDMDNSDQAHDGDTTFAPEAWKPPSGRSPQ